MTSLPTALEYGHVVARILLAVADSTDPDRLPDAVPAVGKISFTPRETVRRLVSPSPTLVINQSIECTLDSEGYLTDPQGERGVWLVAGQYSVAYRVNGATMPAHNIVVTDQYDETNPLDLTTAMPPGGPVLTPSQYAELSTRINALDGSVAPAMTLTNATEIPTILTGRIDLVYTQPTTVQFEAPGRTEIALSIEGIEHVTWEGAVVNGVPAATGVVWASALWRDVDETWYVLCEQAAYGGSGGSGGDGLAVKMAVQEFPIYSNYVDERDEDGWPLTRLLEPRLGSSGEGRQVDLYIEVPKEDGGVVKHYIKPPATSGLSKNAFTDTALYEHTNSSWTHGMTWDISKWDMQGADYEFTFHAEWIGTDTKWVPGTKITMPKEIIPPWWPERIEHQILVPWATNRERVTLVINKNEGISLEYGDWEPPIPPPPQGKAAWYLTVPIKGRFKYRNFIEPTP